ncbi:hypothetical protein Glove_152g42 [Diversispora epigaea]|uniref:Uncharacterized protein n=1 Tax=Diversispora epigaea TaxID=1348612 RepID=A0A397J1A5_9GLOM|nr:hypothetical protein Glove_152g42 [Diversispora epigaea]
MSKNESSESSESSDDENKIDKLNSFISSLDTKRKRNNDNSLENRKKKRIQERTEAYEESEYNLTTRESGSSKKKVDYQDLLGAIQEETGFSGLKQKLASLESGGNKGSYKQPLPAPLPKRIQDKLNRQAAYEETKKDINKWEPIVMQNREAEHLKFPMNPVPHYQPTNNTLTGNFQPSTNLEKEVDTALIESGAKEKDIQKFEELQLSKLSVEEIIARQKELRRMRELMFREEIKAKRIAKIKSKTYRKIKRKEREKNKLSVEQFGDKETIKEEQMKLESARAQERMSLRHKNTSKWAKQTLKYGANDKSSQHAIAEQLKKHEELKRKIHDLNSDEDSDYESSSSLLSNNDGDQKEDKGMINTVKEKVFDELASFEMKTREEEEKVIPKGILGMKFMRDAIENERKINKGLIDDFVEELENENFSGSDNDDKNNNQEKQQKIKNDDNNNNNNNKIFNGRMKIGAKKKSNSDNSNNLNNLNNLDDSDDLDNLVIEKRPVIEVINSDSKKDDKKDDKKDLQSEQNKQNNDESQNKNNSNNNEENPWLQIDTTVTSKILNHKNNKRIKSSGENKSDKLISKTKKHQLKNQIKEDDVEIDVNKTFTIITTATTTQIVDNQDKVKESKKKKKKNVTSNNNTKIDKNLSDSNNENDETIKNFVHVKNSTAFSHRELVARAFANDNVVDEFVAEKQEIIQEDEPKEKDVTLPGWGSWIGKGVKQSKQKKKVVIKPLPGEGVEAKKRQDAKLDHVIINEKRIKKTKKYLSTDIPHPFETKEQYERSLRTPIGNEWNTREVFQKMITPRVITKMGCVIDPLNVPFQTTNDYADDDNED